MTTPRSEVPHSSGAARRHRIRVLRHQINARDGLQVLIEEHAGYEPGSNTYIPQIEAWEKKGFRTGILMAYVLSIIQPTPPCRQCHRDLPIDIVDSMSGVVAVTDLEGTYGHPYLIPDPYARWIADEMFRGAQRISRTTTP